MRPPLRRPGLFMMLAPILVAAACAPSIAPAPISPAPISPAPIAPAPISPAPASGPAPAPAPAPAPRPPAAEPPSPLLGAPVPDHAWPLLRGGTSRTSAYRGSVLIIDFWSTDCAPCLRAFPALEALHLKHQGRGLRVLAVSEDNDEAKVPPFVTQHNFSLPVALDVEQSAGRIFSVISLPTTLIVDRKGVVRFVHRGAADADLAAMARQVDLLLAE